jgi:hypothetical protein
MDFYVLQDLPGIRPREFGTNPGPDSIFVLQVAGSNLATSVRSLRSYTRLTKSDLYQPVSLPR